MSEAVTTDQVLKARQLNLDTSIYGTIAEIGAGQEVSRCFFSVGGAAGTVAKTMSAYDMTFSDEIYGPATRYVSRDRLVNMLDHEYELLEERLGDSRGPTSKFFAFANTVAAQNYMGTNECHGWMGIRFQLEPMSPPNDIHLHVRMRDESNFLQQQALGIFGVNLIYGAYKHFSNLDQLILSLADDLGKERIEVDSIEFHGPFFGDVDNRLMTLKLVVTGLAHAVLLGADGTIQQASETFHNRPVIIERGSFRPITNANVEMLHAAERQFHKEFPDTKKPPISFFELTVDNLNSSDPLKAKDVLNSCEMLAATGCGILVTSYPEYYRLVEYLRRFTEEAVALVVGPNTLVQIFRPSYYTHLPGGILEAFGKLFEQKVHMYVYPMKQAFYEQYFSKRDDPPPKVSEEVVTLENVQVNNAQTNLLAYLRENKFLLPIENAVLCADELLADEIRKLIASGNCDWKQYVPVEVAAIIEKRKMFR